MSSIQRKHKEVGDEYGTETTTTGKGPTENERN